MVDVLANDLDPAGGLLVVERAQAASGQLDVAVVAGRWLRISAAVATLDTPSQTVSYTISNGTVSGVEGQVTVSQKPEPKDTSPITAADRVVVRAGGSVTAAVLDNDVSPTGDKLSLVTDLDISAPGELEVHPPRGVTGDVGRAFVSGRVIRFVAPQRFAERDTVRVPHSVTDTDGASAAGELLVTIVPASAGNNAPQPPHLEGRAVAGGRATLRIPGSGVDPDGDSVTVTGIDTAPRLGRIAELGANGLVYEAFPGSAGTDEFHYTVTDSRGATAAGLARVVIVPPGRPQAPLAVDDRVLAAPGRTVHVDAIANDFVGTGEGVRVALQGRVGGASYDSGTDLVDIVVPEDVGAPSVQAVYSVDNGLDSSLATITVRAVEGYNNPPVVYDAYGVADDSEAVEIDVLEDAYDPDGDADDLVVVDVFHPTATFTDTSVKVERGDAPQVVPFRVEDADGAPAVASLYVPATGTGVPYVKDGAFIEVGTNGTVTGRLSDYVVSPSGEKVRLAGGDAAFAAPDQADAEVIDDQTFTLSGTSDYVGPGALLLRVTTRAGTARGATTTLLTVPAQIGRPKPVLTCPEVPFEVVQGGEITLDIPSLCNVYTADPGEAEGLAYDVAWVDQPSGLDLGAPGSGRVTVAASGGARAGTEAVLEVRAGDSDPRQVRVRVVEAPPPRLLPVTVQDLEPGESRTIDLAPYLLAGVADPEKTLLSVERVGPGDASAQRSGRTQVTLRGGPRGGSAAFRVVMSDVDDPDAGPERRAEGRLEFEVGAVPDAPTDVFARSMDDPSEMNIYFVPGNDNGSPVTRYLVKNLVTGRVTPCAGDGCLVENLKVGRDYNFAVAAVNKFGQGPWSPPSIMVVAGDKPLPPRNVTLQSRDDGVMTVGWSAPEKNGDSSATVTKYVVTVGGRSTSTDGTARSATVGGISNQNPNRVTVVAKNAVGFSDPTEVVPGWHGLGTPEVPTGVAVSDRGSGTSDSTTLDISWRAAAPNGPGETRYTVEVSRNDGAFRTAPGCDKVTALTCPQSVPYDGAILAYRVIAFNDPAADNAGGGEAPRQSSPSAPAKFEAIGTPQAWGSWSVVATGEDNQVHLTAPVPDSRGADSVVTISVGPQGESVERSIPSGAEIDRTLWTGTDDVVSTVTLQLCNERKCNTPVSKQVQSYGELTSDHIHVAGGEGQAGSRVVHWTVTTNGNGRPTTLHYRLPNGNVLTKAVPSGSTQTTVSFDTGDYEKTVRLEAWLQDAIPRRTREESADGTSGSPSPLGVNLTRNPCGGTDQPACKSGSGGGGGLFACSGTETCSNAMVSVTGIVAGDDTVTCETSYGLDVRPDEESFAVNGTKAVASYPHEGGTVQASCSSAKYSQSGSDALGWPDDRTSPSARAASYGP